MAARARLDHFRVRDGLGFQDNEIAIYEFGGRRSFDDAARFLSQQQLVSVVRPTLNRSNQRHILEDKWVAAHHAAGIAIPSPRTLCLWHGKHGVTFSGRKLGNLAQLEAELRDSGCRELAFKPRGGRQGRALILARVSGDGEKLAIESGKSMLTLAEFNERLEKDDFGDYGGGYHGWLIQERIAQHPSLGAVNPDSLNTVRLVTVNTVDAGPRFLGAALRMGRSGSVVDSWAMGGVSAGIDLETGVLGKAVFRPEHGGSWVSSHPDTGEQIEGRTVPHWQSCLDLAREAALAYSGVGTVGWDIAVTPEGALLVEGNSDWSLPLIQVHSDGLLGSLLAEEVIRRGGDLAFRWPTLTGIYAKKGKTKARKWLNKVYPRW